ncbi:hypothetical protein M0R45_027230 [Rubus argutus]|uniref:Uncharacterized protein n=1 Tax=Rubus argutus TaxID=59490 RepID=A0AAW1WZW1_RUBAR
MIKRTLPDSVSKKLDGTSTSLFPLFSILVKSVEPRFHIEDRIFVLFTRGDSDLLKPDDWSDLGPGVLVISGEGDLFFSVLGLSARHLLAIERKRENVERGREGYASSTENYKKYTTCFHQI